MRAAPLHNAGYLLLAAAALVPALAAQEPSTIARLQAVEQEQSLDDPALKPWHLKMNVQLFDAKGTTSEAGTIEEWWAAPENYRQVFSTPSYTATVVRNASGTLKTPGTGSAPLLVGEILRLVTHPVDLANELPHSSPTTRPQKLGKFDADCILLDKKIKGVSFAPLGLYPTYCVQRGSNLLMARSDLSELSVLTAGGSFQSKHIPIDLTLLMAGVKVASEHVAALESIPATAAEFSNVDGLAATVDQPVPVSSGTMAGKILKSVAPVYPQQARQHGAEGTVILHAVIGTDGRIHNLNLVSAPDGDLAVAAAVAVRQWTYSPYTVNGSPVPVETTINVNFKMGH